MTATLIAILLFFIFLLLSGIHIYWAFGGKWASTAVIPTKEDEVKIAMPSAFGTLVVAAGLMGFGLLVLARSGLLDISLPNWLLKYGLWAIAGIFLLRAVGDFRYVGFFKKYKKTRFGRNDTKYYSPLCLAIVLMILVMQWV
ncbi:DUF3995 domain-containing protein [Pedobacter hiemivivus]|uniref:DUF3995 domain-containing protein n=1 Tax=Pedobacter hiemivivus TaxID=2530454 RepID=A0A4R0NBH9_9SPHI|nr:DUF3995 domain-containing protein [Pedobacter hiemivivus]TCC96977.1 DUF3995 domain-containing protein [Pedobacter hiemivivus]